MLHVYIYSCSSKHVLEEIIRWEVAEKWFPCELTANQGNKNGLTGRNEGLNIAGDIFPSSAIVQLIGQVFFTSI